MIEKVTGVVIHSPVDGLISYGIDSERQVHVWWNGPAPDGVTHIRSELIGVDFSVKKEDVLKGSGSTDYTITGIYDPEDEG
jgi:hypothetical protein